MSLLQLASAMDVSKSTLQKLISGKVTLTMASRLGTTRSALQRFIDGDTSIAMASVLGVTKSTAQELRDAIGKQGAIGLVIGLAIKSPGGETEEC